MSQKKLYVDVFPVPLWFISYLERFGNVYDKALIPTLKSINARRTIKYQGGAAKPIKPLPPIEEEDSQVEPTQLAPPTQDSGKKRKADSEPEGAPPAKRVDCGEDLAPVSGGSGGVQKKVWRPSMPACAQANYCFDEHGLTTPTNLNKPYYSASMKGWTQAKCIRCEEYLDTQDHEHLRDLRYNLPEPLAKDSSNPPRFKTRFVPLCRNCTPGILEELRANPQTYNGRGVCYWIMPF